MIYVVAYDIESDRIRTKLAKLLEGYGRRLQRSVFLCDMTAKRCATLKSTMKALAGKDSGDIVIIPLCQGCQGKIRHLGSEVKNFEIL